MFRIELKLGAISSYEAFFSSSCSRRSSVLSFISIMLCEYGYDRILPNFEREGLLCELQKELQIPGQ